MAFTTMSASNRIGLDYRAESQDLLEMPTPLIDVHSHINGEDAARVFFAGRKPLRHSSDLFDDMAT